MRNKKQPRIRLSELNGDAGQRTKFFALLNLGLVQSLASGILSAPEAIELFYHAENCIYVRHHFRNKNANAIMSHGVQLPDLFESLSAEEASREFYHELETMRLLAMKLLTTRSRDFTSSRVVA